MHMLVSMYYCIYMFSYGPYGPEIKHYYYYYYYSYYYYSYYYYYYYNVLCINFHTNHKYSLQIINVDNEVSLTPNAWRKVDPYAVKFKGDIFRNGKKLFFSHLVVLLLLLPILCRAALYCRIIAHWRSGQEELVRS